MKIFKHKKPELMALEKERKKKAAHWPEIEMNVLCI